MLVSIDFITWVTTEARAQGWSDSELARRIGKSQTTISRIVNRERSPNWDFCAGVARAFNLPADQVFRHAGLLPPIPPAVAETREVERLFNALPPERRLIILDILRGMVGIQRTLPPGIDLNGPLTDEIRRQIAAWLKPALMDKAAWQSTVERYNQLFDATPDALKPGLIYGIGHAVAEIISRRKNETQGDESANEEKAHHETGGKH